MTSPDRVLEPDTLNGSGSELSSGSSPKRTFSVGKRHGAASNPWDSTICNMAVCVGNAIFRIRAGPVQKIR